jgi:hypothetical protein
MLNCTKLLLFLTLGNAFICTFVSRLFLLSKRLINSRLVLKPIQTTSSIFIARVGGGGGVALHQVKHAIGNDTELLLSCFRAGSCRVTLFERQPVRISSGGHLAAVPLGLRKAATDQ